MIRWLTSGKVAFEFMSVSSVPPRGGNQCVQVWPRHSQECRSPLERDGRAGTPEEKGQPGPWGPAARNVLPGGEGMALGFGRGWTGAVGSGRLSRRGSCLGKGVGREKLEWFSLARTKELGWGREASHLSGFTEAHPLPFPCYSLQRP